MNKHHWLQLFAEDGGGEAPAEVPAEVPAEAPGTQAEASPPDPTARHWQRVDEIYGRMMQQAETLREVFPDFDLRLELQNPTFAQALGCGMTPESAYLAVHAAQILPAAMAYGAQYAREQLASSLMGGNRPEENGLSGGGAVKMGSGVGSLSRGEYDRICRMVEQGERISFG